MNNLYHIRAFAITLIILWHFQIIEGHTGVALFFTLSGYLYSKLIDKKINWKQFYINRGLRLFPLFIIIVLLVGVNYRDELPRYVIGILRGFIFPTWPHGGWAITAEIHCYLLLPVILFLFNKYKILYLLFLTLFIRVLSLAIDVQYISYFTIFGRFDQFLIGFVMGLNRKDRIGKGDMTIIFILFFAVYLFFTLLGGFYGTSHFPKSVLWVLIPLLEGLFYSIFIKWYERLRVNTDLSIALTWVGKISYSIFLLHFFTLDSYPLLTIVLIIPVSSLSYLIIERPFMRLQKEYII